METIPPTQDALLQHCRRVAYQAGIWTTCELAQQQTPTPVGHCTKEASHGLWYGQHYHWPPKLVLNWSSVAAKVQMTVVQGVLARKQSGSVLNFVAAIVITSTTHTFFLDGLSIISLFHLFHSHLWAAPTSKFSKTKHQRSCQKKLALLSASSPIFRCT